MTPVLEVVDLVKHFGPVRAVDGVSLAVGQGEVLGLVGESGSGKTTLGRCVTRLMAVTAGEVRINGTDIAGLTRRRLRPLRRHFNIVFQDPSSSLNPRMTVEAIISEPLRLHHIGTGASRRQRVAVMYLGVLVEVADRAELFASPRHPSTQALLSAAPIPDPAAQRARQRIVLSGEIPSPIDPPAGCRFHTRCPVAVEECANFVPPLRAVGPSGRLVACHLVGDDGNGPRLV